MAGRHGGKVALITGASRGTEPRGAQDGADVIAVHMCPPIDPVAYPLATPTDLRSTANQLRPIVMVDDDTVLMHTGDDDLSCGMTLARQRIASGASTRA